MNSKEIEFIVKDCLLDAFEEAIKDRLKQADQMASNKNYKAASYQSDRAFIYEEAVTIAMEAVRKAFSEIN